jgi:microcystin-dependent protein
MPVLTIDKQYRDGIILTEEQLDAAFASITSLLNTTGLGSDNIQDNSVGSAELQTGSVTNTKLATASVSTVKIQDEAINLAKLATELRAYLLPTGMVVDWTSALAPTGWLLCDGGEYNRTTYADLFNVVGATYGNGNGTTTFNVPDLRGMIKRMPGGTATTNAGLRDPDSAGRVKITDWTTLYSGLGSVQKGGIESHAHTITTTSNASNPASFANGGGGGATGSQGVNATGGNETRMINFYLNCIIKT